MKPTVKKWFKVSFVMNFLAMVIAFSPKELYMSMSIIRHSPILNPLSRLLVSGDLLIHFLVLALLMISYIEEDWYSKFRLRLFIVIFTGLNTMLILISLLLLFDIGLYSLLFWLIMGYRTITFAVNFKLIHLCSRIL